MGMARHGRAHLKTSRRDRVLFIRAVPLVCISRKIATSNVAHSLGVPRRHSCCSPNTQDQTRLNTHRDRGERKLRGSRSRVCLFSRYSRTPLPNRRRDESHAAREERAPRPESRPIVQREAFRNDPAGFHDVSMVESAAALVVLGYVEEV